MNHIELTDKLLKLFPWNDQYIYLHYMYTKQKNENNEVLIINMIYQNISCSVNSIEWKFQYYNNKIWHNNAYISGAYGFHCTQELIDFTDGDLLKFANVVKDKFIDFMIENIQFSTYLPLYIIELILEKNPYLITKIPIVDSEVKAKYNNVNKLLNSGIV